MATVATPTNLNGSLELPGSSKLVYLPRNVGDQDETKLCDDPEPRSVEMARVDHAGVPHVHGTGGGELPRLLPRRGSRPAPPTIEDFGGHLGDILVPRSQSRRRPLRRRVVQDGTQVADLIALQPGARNPGPEPGPGPCARRPQRMTNADWGGSLADVLGPPVEPWRLRPTQRGLPREYVRRRRGRAVATLEDWGGTLSEVLVPVTSQPSTEHTVAEATAAIAASFRRRGVDGDARWRRREDDMRDDDRRSPPPQARAVASHGSGQALPAPGRSRAGLEAGPSTPREEGSSNVLLLPGGHKMGRAVLRRVSYRCPITNGTGGAEDHDSCTICLEDFEHLEVLLRVPCGHLFHTECIKVWLENDRSCPNCRHPVTVPRRAPSERASG